MKTTKRWLPLLLSMTLLMTTPAVMVSAAQKTPALESSKAVSASTANPQAVLSTVITTTGGDMFRTPDSLDATNAEQTGQMSTVKKYTLYGDDGWLLEVNHNTFGNQQSSLDLEAPAAEPMNSYYSVEFMLPNTQKRVFLTGLTAENADEVQEKIIKEYKEGVNFEIEDFSFIDAEKTQFTQEDDNLCWAAAASNLLHYTGWGQQAGFQTEDDLFDLYQENFYDGGGWEEVGFSWFFNGYTDIFHSSEYGIASVKSEESGGYLTDYAYDALVKNYIFDSNDISPMTKLNQAIRDLKNGYGVFMNVYFYGYGGGHALSMWGVILNEEYPEDDKRRLDAVILSDSDSAMMPEEDRRTAPNDYYVFSTTPFYDSEYSVDSWISTEYSNAVISVMGSLKPYSEDVEKELAVDASKNKSGSIDLCIQEIYAATVEHTDYHDTKFTEGNTIYFQPLLVNTGAVDCEDSEITVSLRIKDEYGNIVEDLDSVLNYEQYPNFYHNLETDDSIEVSGLSVGKYTAEFTVNPDHVISEAYYINNTYSYAFTVVTKSFEIDNLKIVPDSRSFEDVTDFTEVPMTYTGFENIQASGYALFASYCDSDGKWSDLIRCDKSAIYDYWDEDSESDDEGFAYLSSLPEKGYVFKNGHQVKFILVAEMEEGYHLLVSSDVYELKYELYQIVPVDDFQTIDYTLLERGDTHMANGEKITFTIKNLSSENYGESEIRYQVYGQYKDSEGQFQSADMVNYQSITLKPGEESAPLTIDSWMEAPFQGRVIVTVEMYVMPNGMFVSQPVGILRFREENSLVVNIYEFMDEDDPTDGYTSLYEAVRYYQEQGFTDEVITFQPLEIYEAIYDEETDEYIISEDYYLSPAMVSCTAGMPIYSTVRIDGTFEDPDETTDYPLGAWVYFGPMYGEREGKETASMFNVGKNGSLYLKNMKLTADCEDTDGAVIHNDGGSVSLDSVLTAQSLTNGVSGAIYSDGGKLLIKNSTFYSNDGHDISDISLTNGADAAILNSLFLNHAETTAAIIGNTDSTLRMVNSTFTMNQSKTISSLGETFLLGCDFSSYIPESEEFGYDIPSEKDLQSYSPTGNITAYACSFERIGDDVKTYYCEKGLGMEDLYVLSEDEGFLLEETDDYTMDGYLFYLAQPIHEVDYRIDADNDTLVIKVSDEYTDTQIKTDFPAEDYALDALGRSRVNHNTYGFMRLSRENQRKDEESSVDQSSQEQSSKDESSEVESSQEQSSKDESSKGESSQEQSGGKRPVSAPPTSNPGQPQPSNPILTGDSSPLLVILFVLLTGAAVAVVLVPKKKKN